MKKRETDYLVVYQGQDQNGRTCQGNLDIRVTPRFELPTELAITRELIQEKIGKEWSIVILNIIKFPIK